MTHGFTRPPPAAARTRSDIAAMLLAISLVGTLVLIATASFS